MNFDARGKYLQLRFLINFKLLVKLFTAARQLL